MALNINKITGGSAQVQIDDTAIAHTRGGVTVTITPNNRLRTVDQHGENAVDVVHVGDDVRITVPFVQWDGATLVEMYNPALDGTTSSSGGDEFIGVGRSAGYIYSDSNMKIIPFTASEVAKKAEFWRTTPIGAFDVAWSNDDDIILETEYVAMADPANHDEGEFVGRLFTG